jgi:PHD/YefM family antitoxin component YafN of YafNO toxin-antitoxin module
MIQVRDIHPVTEFKRRTAEFRRRLKKSGQPELLTIDGRAALVVQDAQAYQKLLDALDRAETIAGIAEGLADVEAGRTISLDQLSRDLRAKINRVKRRSA